MALVFPALPGLAWSVTKAPTFQTRIQRAVSGRELRALDYPYPLVAIHAGLRVLARQPGSRVRRIAHAAGVLPDVPGRLWHVSVSGSRAIIRSLASISGPVIQHGRLPASAHDGHGVAGRRLCRADRRAQFGRRCLFRRDNAKPVGLQRRSGYRAIDICDSPQLPVW